MINKDLKARDRIFSELPENLKKIMSEYILKEHTHEQVLEDIKKQSYAGKQSVDNPIFQLVVGQTGSGKSNLTVSLNQKNNNFVIIDSDKYKEFRPDTEEILKKHLALYSFLTGPDAYMHRDEMIVDTMQLKYNIIMECAPSKKQGLFVDIDEIRKRGYTPQIAVLGVSRLNSLLSVHERYEAQMQLNYSAAKLTGIERHDESFKALEDSIIEAEKQGVEVKVFRRGRGYLAHPELCYESYNSNNKFSSAVEAMRYEQKIDENDTILNFNERYKILLQQMLNRRAPELQIRQLEEVRHIFVKQLKEREELDGRDNISI